MKRLLIAFAVVAVAVPAFAFAAFQPSANGIPGLATENHLVVRDYNGMRVYEVSSNPQTADERAVYVAWLEAQVFDLQKQLGSIPVTECEVDERVSGLSASIAAVSARIQAFLAR